ncbi:MAG TPA: glycosyltransferase family 9 protein [Alphaproteobacteria bacterium]|nr:glycosyltransferase family 9 protein [Alphaproteobacteria bacterium]
MTNLFILPTRLGDAIFTTGVIDKYKDEPCIIVATPLTAPLFADLPNLNKLIIMGKKPWKAHWINLWKETRGTSWNRIIDLRGSALSYLLKAQERYIWKQPLQRPHKVLQISQCMGSQEPLSPTLWFSEERLARTKLNRPTLAVAPVAGWIGKQWPIDNFITLLSEFCKNNPEAQIAFFAAPNEREQVESLLKALPKDQCLNTIGGHLLDSASLIKSSRLFIGNDSGLLHLSVAVETPTIALFGPSNDKIYGPWSAKTPSPHRVLRAMPLPKKKIIQTPEDTTCYMTGLSVAEVQKSLNEMWEQNKPQLC